MKNSNASICRLCEQPGQIRNSHIIPEFLYKELYDSKHRFDLYTHDGPPKRANIQKGVRERLLCQSCETKFSYYEKYVSEALFRSRTQRIERMRRGIRIFDVNYNDTKLFGLSLLWRILVATHEDFSLNTRQVHRAMLQESLANADAGEEYFYPFSIVVPVEFPDLANKIIGLPRLRTTKDLEFVQVFAGGIYWVFWLLEDTRGLVSSDLVLSKSNVLPVIPNSGLLEGELRACFNSDS